MEYNVGKCGTKEISLSENKSTHFLEFKNIAHNKVAQKLLFLWTEWGISQFLDKDECKEEETHTQKNINPY